MKMCPDNGAAEWEPAPDMQRMGLSGAASLLAGGGFIAILEGLSQLLNVPITRSNGWILGISGLFAVHLATGAGLTPEIPGMPVADLTMRQLWWLGTVIATGGAIYCFTLRRELWEPFLGVVLLIIPHIIGAPVAPESGTSVAPLLAAEFASNSLAAAAVFWLVMGVMLGQLVPHFTEKLET